jgi:hypothetical protein
MALDAMIARTRVMCCPNTHYTTPLRSITSRNSFNSRSICVHSYVITYWLIRSGSVLSRLCRQRSIKMS